MLDNTASSTKTFAQLDEFKYMTQIDDRSQLDQDSAKEELAWLSESIDR
ncbi:hypothetical protein LOOC260_116800 [Paucilactobacillus hokkaidonensis JCM 18461]|uniref:Uncharacterized protein n=1 Tax=Paucilactobacillus hokkaidonensis JCM 18461 TaxID=1291742 RepID=A0A0A1H0H0_9LACO|nr:hypothetical protein [Paucilactobacillus hokkaidonensis]BAP86186.1 hypothetical protein LOOC260_116800 [Paucilactobacillus hokkaidonensis JCM 18461]